MNRLIYSVLIMFFLYSCANNKQQKIDLIRAEEAKLMEDINALNNRDGVEKLVHLYDAYISEFPDDSLSAEFLFKEAQIFMNTQRAKQSIAVLDSLIDKHKNSTLRPQAMHLKGFIWDTKLNSPEMARISFERLLKEYPDHELVKNTAEYIQVLGLTPEEILEKIQKDSLNKD